MRVLRLRKSSCRRRASSCISPGSGPKSSAGRARGPKAFAPGSGEASAFRYRRLECDPQYHSFYMISANQVNCSRFFEVTNGYAAEYLDADLHFIVVQE